MKVGDWVVFDLRIGQITKLDEWAEFSDGSFTTCGHILGRCRPLTLRNKNLIEAFDFWYRQLYEIDGERGFNFPDISQHFGQLSLNAIDNEGLEKNYIDQAKDFVEAAQKYTPTIQGIPLFRPEPKKKLVV